MSNHHQHEDAHYHIHANIFAAEVSETLLKQLRPLGFKAALCKIALDGGWKPLWIITTKRPREGEALDVFTATMGILRNSPVPLKAYAELEMMLHRNVSGCSSGVWNSAGRLPLSKRPDFIRAPRGADLHVFREMTTPYDELDKTLAELGFYEVLDERQRIWTLLMESREDAQRLFDSMKRYFADAQGIRKIEAEFIQRLETASEFSLLPVAASGFYAA